MKSNTTHVFEEKHLWEGEGRRKAIPAAASWTHVNAALHAERVLSTFLAPSSGRDQFNPAPRDAGSYGALLLNATALTVCSKPLSKTKRK